TSSNDFIELYFDKEKMQKIIANLFSNAIKFTQDGGKIDVNIEEDFEYQKVLIKIIDSGIGISQEELPKIFDRFFQVVSSKTKGIEGTGIGLSLTKELVELHHGEITVESEIEKGATFVMSFPLGKNHLKEDELIYTDSELNPREDANEEESILLSDQEDKPLLLIVEDNKDVRDFIIRIIENEYRFYEAEDGEEGLDKAFKYMPDLIISDIMMPKKTGDRMCEELKKDQITCHIPIILLTAKSLEEDKINGLERGADDYLIKPFNDKELLVRINNLIVQRKNLREKYLKEAEINPIEIAVTSLDKKFIERMIKIVEENISNTEFDVRQLADDLHVSRTQLYRKFSSVLGEKPKDFVRKYRIKRAADLIKQNYGNITDVSYQVGFDNLSYFTKCFKQIYNQSPHEYEKDCLNKQK
ncbi:MAG: response regulator, partial [Melioribacteraceae bacterium]|nr:response regulator [Melioribacteraceae bacterium]